MKLILSLVMLFSTLAQAEVSNSPKITGTAPITVTNGNIAMPKSDATHNGWLSSTDWVRFNANSGGGITELTGDVLASGSGAVSATVAFVGGVSAANVAAGAALANAATSSNTASTIVKRSSLGAISVGAITATSVGASGNVTGANLSGTNTGDVTIGTANGLSLVGQALSLAQASGSTTGALSSSDWTTFNSKQAAITPGNISTSTTGVTIGSGTSSTIGPNVTVNIATASGSTTGLLTSTDWITFNSKQSALSIGNLTTSTTGVSITGGTGSIIGSGVSVNVQTASALQPGLLSATDWTTFNSKQSALTIGDLTTSTTGVSITGGTGAVIGSGATVNIQTASGSQPGLLSAANWTTFNNKAPTASPTFSGTVTLPSGSVTSSVWNTGSSQVELGGFTVLRYDNNGAVFFQIRNENTGSSAISKLALSSDVGNFNLLASSVAGGAIVQMLADSAFSGGIQTGTIGNAQYQILTNNSARLTISGAGVVTIPGQLVASSVTDSSSTTTGSLVTSGGLGVAKKVYVGTDLNVAGNANIYKEYDAGNSGTSKTLDFATNGNMQKLTLTGNVTLAFTAPTQAGTPIVLRILTGAGSFTVTWPASVKWSGGTAPTITTTSSKMDLINLLYDGTNYYGTYAQNYTP